MVESFVGKFFPLVPCLKIRQKSRGDGTGPLPHKGVGDRDGCRTPRSGTTRLLPLPVGDFSKIRKTSIFDRLWNFVGGKRRYRLGLWGTPLRGRGSPIAPNFKIENLLQGLKVIRAYPDPPHIWSQISKIRRGVTLSRGPKIFSGFYRGRLAPQTPSDGSRLAPGVYPPRAPKVGQKRTKSRFRHFDFGDFWGDP